MAGIESYGVYVPIYRLSMEVINQMWGGGGKGEKAICNADEDSLTMGVEAARSCLNGVNRKDIDALFFATTTPPYAEKQSASIIAAALDLRENILTADITDSVRAGSIALRSAMDAVKAGSAKKALAIAADCRMPPPKSSFENIFGDGAAAFLVSNENIIVDIEGSFFLTSEFIDIWRLPSERTIRAWEDRFMREEGYLPHMSKAISGLCQQSGVAMKDFARAAFSALDPGNHRELVKRLGLDTKSQVQAPLFDKVGNTGAAFAPMILVAALDEAKPGDRILFGNYGDGADAHVIRVKEGIQKIQARAGMKHNLESKMMLSSYGKYIEFRDLMSFAPGLEFELRTSLPQLWRDRKGTFRYHGHKCGKCGKVQYPMQKYCMYCQADEQFLEEIPLADRKGTVFTYSIDDRSLLDPPNILTAVNLDGGGRVFGQLTDRDASKIKVGLPVEMTFRRIHNALGVHNYFWKCKPIR